MKKIFIITNFVVIGAFCGMFCLSFGGLYSPTRYSSYEIANSKNSYIRFSLRSLSQFGFAENQTYNLITRWKMKRPLFDTYILINPDYGYWRKYYLTTDSLPPKIIGFNGDMRFNFLYNCDYKMPANTGYNQYIFAVRNESNSIAGYLEEGFDLPPNHSIRLSITPKVFQESVVSPFD
ncbi:hypothetical protein, partial [Leptospira adleri]